MITRIYVDNFRTLVNFEHRPGKLALLLGENGAGKTSVLDVVWGLRRLLIEEASVAEVFPSSSRTRWGSPRPDQVFEIDVLRDEEQYRYRLVVHHQPRKPPSIVEEVFKHFDHPIAESRGGKLRFDKGGGEQVTMPARAGRSALPLVIEASDDGPAREFGDFLYQTWMIAPDPRAMSGNAEKEASFLARDCSNFAAWLRQALVTSPEAVSAARAALHEVIGLKSLQVPKGTTRLMAGFDLPDMKEGLDFEELSDGQRQLIVLYVLRHAVCETASLVAFDEPDNYVALREIQPWLGEVVDLAQSSEGPQIWFVSHHPELLNQLAPSDGTRFLREGVVTRVEPFHGVAGLVPAEVVARGWDGV